MMMRSALYQTNTLSWIYIACSPTQTYNPDFEPTSLCSFSLMLRAQRRSNKYQLVFGLTRSGLEPTIHRTRSEHANHYNPDAVRNIFIQQMYHSSSCCAVPVCQVYVAVTHQSKLTNPRKGLLIKSNTRNLRLRCEEILL